MAEDLTVAESIPWPSNCGRATVAKQLWPSNCGRVTVAERLTRGRAPHPWPSASVAERLASGTRPGSGTDQNARASLAFAKTQNRHSPELRRKRHFPLSKPADWTKPRTTDEGL